MTCSGCGNPLYKGKDRAYLCERGDYRYFLQTPTGRNGNKTCLFLMLNPGTEKGQEERNHRTREKCLELAARWGYSTLWTCNLFAVGGTDPEQALSAADPIGCENDQHISQAVRLADKVVLAWGGIKSPRAVWRARIQNMLHMLDSEVDRAGGKLYVLDPPARDLLTADYQPRHPLPHDNSLPADATKCRRVIPEQVDGRWRLRSAD